MRKPHIVTVLGTRPEAIKLAPVCKEIEADPTLRQSVVVTGQHREIADEMLRAFDVAPEIDLGLLRDGQSLASLGSRALQALDESFESLQPDMVVVQGDTSTAFVAALAAFYRRLPVAHVEAGLRTYDMDAPFPEEANRRLIGVLGRWHFAPTAWSRRNLLEEGVDPASIVVTGNTVVDALNLLSAPEGSQPESVDLARALKAERMVVVTSHRRENWGAPQRAIAEALRSAAIAYPHVVFLVPLHPNPIVRDALVPSLLGLPNVVLSEPLGYRDMLIALRHAYCAVSDSGGIQEEGAVLGTPVLLLRDVTERPEGAFMGAVRMAGTSPVRLYAELDRMLSDQAVRDRAARATTVFGDGFASCRIVAAIKKSFGLEAREIEEFDAGLCATLNEETA